jgi:arylsulfatase A-like enzyme
MAAQPEEPLDTAAETLPPPAPAVDDESQTLLPGEPHASLGALLVRDVRRGAAAGLCAAAAVALVEYFVALWAWQGERRLPTLLRFLALDTTLVTVGLLVFLPLTVLAFAAPRLFLAAASGARARAWPGVGAGVPAAGAPLQAAAAWIWATLLGAGAYAGASFGLTLLFQRKFKEPTLIAAALAGLQLGLILVLGGMTFLVALGLGRAGARLAGRLGRANPFGRVGAALAALAVLAAVALVFLLRALPALRDVVPWRLVLNFALFALAAGLAARWLWRRGGLLPHDPLRRRRVRLAAGAAALAVLPATLVYWGADPEAKSVAVSASPLLGHLVELVRFLNDFDRDGYGSLLGENDCAPFNPDIHPNARDIPDNGIDENCNGRDFSTKDLPSYEAGERMAVPDAYQRDWNVLFITVDATRFDHLGLGGYKQKKGRDTSPNLDALAARSISFNFANAPSAGTMASVPALVTSKFFHSGIALGPERRPMPPKVLPENTLLAEVMKRGGYATGAVLTHEYFNDWGLDQGFDFYDNALGKTHDANSITSPDVTAKAEAFIAGQGQKKWFLWCHYLDPHGKYMPHPGEVQFGSSEEDLYDGEIAYTDKWLGKLFDYLAHSPVAGKTIIVVTADHGDGFMEHGQINHGQTLYKELLHVPLIVYVPEAEPHTVDGPVSGLDIFPTLADLAGIDIHDLAIEGVSLVPQLFYGRDARERVVFSETNYPDPLRTVITDRWKLVENLKAATYELYDLHKDAWEKSNVYGREPKEAERMRGLLDEWLDRVYYARDPTSQAEKVREEEYLLKTPPKPEHALGAEVGDLRVIGWDAGKGPFSAGKEVGLTVYLGVARATTANYRVELELASSAAGPGPRPSARQEKAPAGDGVFPSSKWHPGETIKESFRLRLPPGVSGELRLGLRVFDAGHRLLAAAGGATQLDLGALTVDAAPAP